MALGFPSANRAPLVTVGPVVWEACHFLNQRARSALLRWVVERGLLVTELPLEAYPRIAYFLERYADLEIDFADAALSWLAETTGCYRILTVDERDFSTIRLEGRKRFELVPWYAYAGPKP